MRYLGNGGYWAFRLKVVRHRLVKIGVVLSNCQVPEFAEPQTAPCGYSVPDEIRVNKYINHMQGLSHQSSGSLPLAWPGDYLHLHRLRLRGLAATLNIPPTQWLDPLL